MPSCIDPRIGANDRARQTWLQKRIPQQFRSGILHNASCMLSGRVLQWAGRIGYFLIIAHLLRPAGYGTFVACTALIGAMAPFTALGTDHVMIKHASRNRDVLPRYLGNALLVTVLLGSVLTLFVLLIRPRVLPSSATVTMVAAVAIADLFGMPMTYTCLLVFQTLGQFRRCTQLLALSTGLRLIAALLLWGFTTPTAVHWAYLYAASSAVVVICGLVAVSRYASPHFQLDLVVPSLREGFYFATSVASQSIYGDIDKTMLARLSTVEATAIYAVAYRFLDAALLPIRSLAEATYPEFFRQGTQGVTSAFGFARRILPRSAIYGLGTTIALFLGAGLVQFVLGRAYAESAAALRWLCPLALVHSLQAFLRDTLTGANYQWQRTSLDIGMATFNVLINLWIIRAYAWRGAAWCSLMTDSLLTVLLFIIIRGHLKRERIAASSATTAQTAQPMFVTGEQ